MCECLAGFLWIAQHLKRNAFYGSSEILRLGLSGCCHWPWPQWYQTVKYPLKKDQQWVSYKSNNTIQLIQSQKQRNSKWIPDRTNSSATTTLTLTLRCLSLSLSLSLSRFLWHDISPRQRRQLPAKQWTTIGYLQYDSAFWLPSTTPNQ